MQNNQPVDPMLLQKMMEDDDSEIRAELEQTLNAELAKPEGEIDYALVMEISEALCKIYGISEVELARGQKKCIARLFPKQNCQKRIANKRVKPLVACAIVICSLLFVAHLPIRSAGVDLIPEIVNVLDGSVILSLDGSRNAHLQPVKRQDDPWGIADDLEAIGIPAFVPSYAPDGIREVRRTMEKNTHRSELSVWYDYGEGHFLFCATTLHDTKSWDAAWGIPTETYQLKNGDCNGIYMITLEEEDRYYAVFAVDHTRYLFSAYGVDFAVCHAMIESIMAEPAATGSIKNEPDV